MSYNEILSDLKNSIRKARDYIPKLCNSLREEDPTLPDKEINERVRKDCLTLGLSSDYVNECIPDEFKNIKKIEAGKKASHKKKVVLDTKGQTINDDNNNTHNNLAEITPARYYSNGETEPNLTSVEKPIETISSDDISTKQEDINIEKDYYYFNPSQYTKLVIDLMRVKQTAKYTGVYIKSNGDVETKIG